MKQVNIHFAKTHLSSLLEEVAAGDEIIVARAGKPIARLVPYVANTTPRELGALAGQLSQRADCWESDAEAESTFYQEVLPMQPLKAAEAAPVKPFGKP